MPPHSLIHIFLPIVLASADEIEIPDSVLFVPFILCIDESLATVEHEANM